MYPPRRSANTVVMRKLQANINSGEDVEFERSDVHIAAVFLKRFLENFPNLFWLMSCLRTFCTQVANIAQYSSQVHLFPELSKESRLSYCQDLVIKKLPDQNYGIIKYLVLFLSLVRFSSSLDISYRSSFQVVDSADMNKMTAANLAVVFGPNLIWSKDKMTSLSSIGPINTFTEFLFSNMHKIFSM